jgi:nicotinamidase-related amidase
MDELPLPPHFDPTRVGDVWRVSYGARASEAEAWAREHRIGPAAADEMRICLLLVDVQNTFCVPGFELFVGGRSGTGAVDDNVRLCEFLYRNLARVTRIVVTLDTHQAAQIFHAVFLVDEGGRHPEPPALVAVADVERGLWRVNPAICASLGIEVEQANDHLRHYVRALEARGKYALTVWPYHAMLGSIGHALVSAIEEAVFFHTLARGSQPRFEMKGGHPLTEHYSALGPEITEGPNGEVIAKPNEALVEELLGFDAVIVAGQAKSHCVAWTIDDLLARGRRGDARLARKVYLLEDCSSAVVIPGVLDYTEEADAAYRRFAEAGMHVVRSTEPMGSWPGFGDST